jgi:60 kDa SS-A/Ro ribonucleoprotein
MSRKSYAAIVAEPTPQRWEPTAPTQVKNRAGGYVFAVDDWTQLDRFLILGSDAPTYYAGARELTKQNTAVVERCLATDFIKTISRVVEVSTKGLAPKNDPAIYALALAAMFDAGERAFAGVKTLETTLADAKHKDQLVRSAALIALRDVCRTGTHLFQWMEFMKAIGQSRGRKHMRRSAAFVRRVSQWFNEKPIDKAALQIIKYRARSGWSHCDVMRLAHPAAVDGIEKSAEWVAVRKALYQWARGLPHSTEHLPAIVRAHVDAMKSKDVKEIIYLATQYRLPWEALPTEFATKPEVREALLPHMGLTAMIRQLGAMTASGVLVPLGGSQATVIKRLKDQDEIRRSRVHPFGVLVAMSVYRGGQSLGAMRRGASVSWTPDQRILDALDEAFYKAFENVVPTGKRRLLALDVSGSVGSPIMGSPLSVREAEAAMAMVTMRTEDNTHLIKFSGDGRNAFTASQRALVDVLYRSYGVAPFEVGARSRLDEVVRTMENQQFGPTDCALPMLYALDRKLEVDSFEIYTDNETWQGSVHPHEALRRYRQETGIPAKLVAVGMTATEYSIADPNDAGQMNVVGFDASAPRIIADFVRGSERAEAVEEDDDGAED